MNKIIKLSFALITIIIIGMPPSPSHAKESLISPLHDDAFVKTWATKAIQDVMKYDYSNVDEHFDGARQYFTKNGYEGFYMALKNSSTIDATKKRKLSISTKLLAPVTLCQKRVRNGYYTWVIDVRAKTSYASNAKAATEDYNYSLVIVRSDEDQNKDKIAILNWVTSRSKSNEPICKAVNDSIYTEDFFASLPMLLKVKVTAYIRNQIDSGALKMDFDRCKIPDYLSEDLRNQVSQVTSLEYCKE